MLQEDESDNHMLTGNEKARMGGGYKKDHGHSDNIKSGGESNRFKRTSMLQMLKQRSTDGLIHSIQKAY